MLHQILRNHVLLSQVKQAEALTKKQEERNKAFIPPKERPLMKKTTKGSDEEINKTNMSESVCCLSTTNPHSTCVGCVSAPADGKLDIEAIKDKVKKAKTKKLGAPPVNPAPPSSAATDKKKKNKSKG